jgi:GTP-binding protein
MRSQVPFLDFAPFVSISAKSGQRVGRVLELAVDVWGERRKRIPTGDLNKVIRAAGLRQQPPTGKLGPPKIFYATQVAVAPPTFIFFARHASQVHFSYKRYLENQIRAEFGFDGTPIRLFFRERASGRSSQGEPRAKIRRDPRVKLNGSGKPGLTSSGKAVRKGTSGPKRSTGGSRKQQGT